MAANESLALSTSEYDITSRILRRHFPGVEVWVFGSRACGRARLYSDLDLAVIGRHGIDVVALQQARDDFSDSDLPFRVDLCDWEDLDDTFREIIRKNKIVIQTAADEQ